MKKIIYAMMIVASILLLNCYALASEEIVSNDENVVIVESEKEVEEKSSNSESGVSERPEEIPDTTGLDGASEQVIGTLNKKDKRIKELSEKFDDKTLGTIAYWLEVARFYSTPIFFIFLTIGAFNFFIIGNKKLDKKEQGFGWMVACVIGWVVFQCIPLVFTLVTLGF